MDLVVRSSFVWIIILRFSGSSALSTSYPGEPQIIAPPIQNNQGNNGVNKEQITYLMNFLGDHKEDLATKLAEIAIPISFPELARRIAKPGVVATHNNQLQAQHQSSQNVLHGQQPSPIYTVSTNPHGVIPLPNQMELSSTRGTQVEFGRDPAPTDNKINNNNLQNDMISYAFAGDPTTVKAGSSQSNHQHQQQLAEGSGRVFYLSEYPQNLIVQPSVAEDNQAVQGRKEDKEGGKVAGTKVSRTPLADFPFETVIGIAGGARRPDEHPQISNAAHGDHDKLQQQPLQELPNFMKRPNFPQESFAILDDLYFGGPKARLFQKEPDYAKPPTANAPPLPPPEVSGAAVPARDPPHPSIKASKFEGLVAFVKPDGNVVLSSSPTSADGNNTSPSATADSPSGTPGGGGGDGGGNVTVVPAAGGGDSGPPPAYAWADDAKCENFDTIIDFLLHPRKHNYAACYFRLKGLPAPLGNVMNNNEAASGGAGRVAAGGNAAGGGPPAVANAAGGSGGDVGGGSSGSNDNNQGGQAGRHGGNSPTTYYEVENAMPQPSLVAIIDGSQGGSPGSIGGSSAANPAYRTPNIFTTSRRLRRAVTIGVPSEQYDQPDIQDSPADVHQGNGNRLFRLARAVSYYTRSPAPPAPFVPFYPAAAGCNCMPCMYASMFGPNGAGAGSSQQLLQLPPQPSQIQPRSPALGPMSGAGNNNNNNNEPKDAGPGPQQQPPGIPPGPSGAPPFMFPPAAASPSASMFRGPPIRIPVDGNMVQTLHPHQLPPVPLGYLRRPAPAASPDFWWWMDQQQQQPAGRFVHPGCCACVGGGGGGFQGGYLQQQQQQQPPQHQFLHAGTPPAYGGGQYGMMRYSGQNPPEAEAEPPVAPSGGNSGNGNADQGSSRDDIAALFEDVNKRSSH